MRYLTATLTILALLCSLSWATEDTPPKTLPEPLRLIPPIQLGEHLTLKMWGWQQIRESWTKDEGLGKFQTNTRFIANLDGQKLGLGLIADLTYTQDGEIDQNYIRELCLKLKLTDHLSAQIGCLGLPVERGGSVGNSYGYIPGPGMWNMIGYPSTIPYSNYADGVSVRWENDNLLISGALTGKSGLVFDDPDRFNGLEFSAIAKRKWKSGALGILGQFSGDFSRVGLFGEGKWRDGWFARGEWDHSWNEDYKTSDQNGIYGQLGNGLTQNVELSVLVQSNQQISKTYTELVREKDKKGKVTFKRQEKHSPSGCNSSIGANLRIHSADEILSWKLQYTIPFGEDASGKTLDGKFETEFQLRF